MKRINALLRVLCKEMNSQEKLAYLQKHGFYSYKALENSTIEKIESFANLLESEVNKLPGYKVSEGYLLRTDEKGTYWTLLV